ncbi:unnamed protein product [Microthlaspi erraticum]|uniref:BED-type domain-containing protein n=2 Tax=Microthlaspi erraticum TaxID=1685480 RepID=A0A6D2HIE5_9BRAS|nr:unnamed protein product [Microthlaspi erraticum]
MDFESQETRRSQYMNDENVHFEVNEGAEYVEFDEEVSETEATEDPEHSATQATQAVRKRRKTSRVWKDFEPVGIESDGKERSKCIHCEAKFVTNSRTHGTHHLLRHLEKCPKKPKEGDRHVYDHQVDREMMSEIIIYHDLPFRYVEYEKVRARDKYLNLDCQPICRLTATADVFKRYEIEKDKLREVLAKHDGRVCFTSDLWKDTCTNTGYICLTAHFIDSSWRLSSKILNFCYLKAPHTGEEMANKVMECMKDWGVEKKVFSITLDNAGNNNSMVRLLQGRFELVNGGGLLCDGKFVHVRCCAHILNLIVKEGLELAKDLLENIKESVTYVKSSQGRKEAFHACALREGFKKSGLSLDVATRWNSTYEMLVRALKFRKAFEYLSVYDLNYKSLPSEEEWNRGEKLCEFLKPFYVITNLFSGSKYPTSNVYFTQVWRIQLLLMKFSSCDDAALADMAERMQVKFDKYWEDYSLVLAMGAVLDPRMKLYLLEKAYEAVDPLTAKVKVKELKDNLILLYNDYVARARPSSRVTTIPTPQELITESPLEDDDFDIDIFDLERSIGTGVSNTKTHLDIYLEEPRLDRASFPSYDVLGYWKDNQHRFGELAKMARDLLSIPITTVASESAFSIGSRVLTPYRNRLLPDNVQALLCTRNWLRGFAESEEDENNNQPNENAISGLRAGESSMP